MLVIDGSMGEGGGQILRSSLALSSCLGQPFRIMNIRSARQRPGLQPQHLAAVRAAAAICHARVEGDEKGSQELVFTPDRVAAGEYCFDIGTAGSTTLVLQTVLPALCLADAPSSLLLEGGTHNPFAPPFDFLQHAFLPVLNRMGPTVTAILERPGFVPKGGGRVRVEIQPVAGLRPLEIPERGEIQLQHAEVLLAHLPQHIARRELAVLQQGLGLADSQLTVHVVEEAYGPGNVVCMVITSDYITECFTAFGQRGIPAEQVALKVVKEARRYLRAGVPVGNHLADQLLLPLALAGSGMFVTLPPSLHALTNMEVISAFMGVRIQAQEIRHDAWKISLG
ncbi:MAG: RNA 3'-terminal phosphate cyclase [Granulosicoccaceae bacterium]|jgi:RNA 3'-terminal phosphate cyclase (ATP)